jgi:hypothetical protein
MTDDRQQKTDDSRQSQELYEIGFFVKGYGDGNFKLWELKISGSSRIGTVYKFQVSPLRSTSYEGQAGRWGVRS